MIKASFKDFCEAVALCFERGTLKGSVDEAGVLMVNTPEAPPKEGVKYLDGQEAARIARSGGLLS